MLATAPGRQLKTADRMVVAGRAYSGCMSLSESEFYEAGMSLPPDVRKHVALRLLESVDPDEAFDMASESWLRTEAAAAYDALKDRPVSGNSG